MIKIANRKTTERVFRLLTLVVLCVFPPQLDQSLCAADASTSRWSPVGRWQGQWESQSTGHTGPLRARIRQIDENRYRAVFTGRFLKVIPFAYPAKLDLVATSADDPTSVWKLHSSQRLPLLGTYEMDATVTRDQFRAEFRGRRDVGTFELTR